MSTRPRDRFLAARLEVPSRLEEEAVGALWDAGCLGVEVIPAAGRRRSPRVSLRAYFPGRADGQALTRLIARGLSDFGVPSRRAPRLAVVTERRWVETWQRSLRPMAIGRRFLVVPEGCAAPRGSARLAIRVRFGQAFGTGEHASTRMSLRLLESSLVPGERVADLGTGSGILAMAAALLGARSVLATDIDPVALRVAADNLAENRLAGPVILARAEAAEACRRGPFDLALVNIGASVIGRVLPHLAAALAPRGRAILAGILVEDEEALLSSAGGLGLRLGRRIRSRPWSALLIERPGS